MPLQTFWPENGKNKTPAPPKKNNRIIRRLFLILIIGVLIIIGIGGFYFYQYAGVREINFFLKAPENASIGVPFNIEFEISNNSDKALKDIKISMVLPENVVLLAENQNKRVFDQNFGDLDKNNTFQEKIPVVILGNEQLVKKFTVIASYFPPSLGPKARFEMSKNIEVPVKNSGVKLDLIAPQKVLNNEDFEIEINYQNVSAIDFSNIELELQYPKFFTFNNADPKPFIENNFWKIGNLTRNSSSGIIIFSGRAVGPEQSFFEIKSVLKAEFAGQKYIINEKTININVAPSPLIININIDDKPDVIVFPGTNLKYKIIYQNNSDIGLSDAVIKMRLIGEMFDFKKLRAQGFFDSKNNIITWNAANTPELRLISPAGQGAVEFEIPSKEIYPIKRIGDKNFILKTEAEISSPTVPYYVASDKTIGIAKSEIKIAGNVVIGAEAAFLSGSLPLKVNKPTNFTIRWTIANYSTDISNIEIKAHLQSGARFIGQAKSNVSATPVYNERTQEITWFIDKISATKGVLSKPIEATFQIEAIPNITQMNNQMPLLSQTNLKAFDEFTNIELTNSADAITTQLTVQ